jgi:hypothetical protein
VAREQLQHVIEEANAGGDFVLAAAFNRQLDAMRVSVVLRVKACGAQGCGCGVTSLIVRLLKVSVGFHVGAKAPSLHLRLLSKRGSGTKRMLCGQCGQERYFVNNQRATAL